MANIILTESELKLRMAQIYKEEKLLQIKETWETFSKNEKVFVLEFYKAMHPESKLLQESKTSKEKTAKKSANKTGNNTA